MNTMSKTRNSRAGHAFELDIIHELNELGYDAVSSRQESRRADAAGIDIISESFPFKAQCKSSINIPNLHKLLTETEADLIFYRKQLKRGMRFYQQGDYCILSKQDFYKLLKQQT